MKNNNQIIIILIAVIVAGISFFGGMKYRESQGRNSFLGASQRGQGGQFGGANGRSTAGDIVTMDANSITVKMTDGTSRIVNLTSNTTYSKTDTASKTDLKTGVKVAVFGTVNSDGSVTAQNVQLNPMFKIPGRAGM